MWLLEENGRVVQYCGGYEHFWPRSCVQVRIRVRTYATVVSTTHACLGNKIGCGTCPSDEDGRAVTTYDLIGCRPWACVP
jgi:hypothetical protein